MPAMAVQYYTAVDDDDGWWNFPPLSRIVIVFIQIVELDKERQKNYQLSEACVKMMNLRKKNTQILII